MACDEGHACEAGAASQTPCGTGTSASANSGSCGQCAAGTFQDTVAQGSCKACPPGSYCLQGSSAPITCPPGRYRSTAGATLEADCLPCDSGHACASNSTSATEVQCAAGMYAQCSGGECELY